MNLAIRVFQWVRNKATATFTEDLHKDKNDYILANPPFNPKMVLSVENCKFTLGGEIITPPESNANYICFTYH